MNTVKIPRKDWHRTLDEFSRKHEGWLTSIDVLATAIGAQPEIHELPLVGLTSEPGDGGTISIAVARSGGDHLTHTIRGVAHLWIEQTDEGADVALEIEAAGGTKTILRFRTAVLPEMVDGIAARR